MTALLLGHRGDPEHHPENTVAGFASAMQCGADGVELDVHLSAGGEVVVIHDDTVDRTTRGSGPVAAHSWQELAALGVPRLCDVLDVVRGGVVAVELKPPYAQAPHLARAVAGVARAAHALDRLQLLAFDHAHLAAAPDEVPRVALVRDLPPDPLRVLDDAHAVALAPWWEHVDAALCATLRERGRAVIAWTVDSAGDAARLRDDGVEAIITNRPCALRSAV